MGVMEDLYGQHWRDLASIVDEVRRGVSADDPWSENAVVESFNKIYEREFSEEKLESPHYQSLRRGITRGVRALEAEYAAEEAEREQRFQEFWSERYLTREFRTPYSESWTIWATDSGERYADATLQIMDKEAVITLVLRDEDRPPWASINSFKGSFWVALSASCRSVMCRSSGPAASSTLRTRASS